MLMRILFWATVPAMPTPNGILISSVLANFVSSSEESCLTSKSLATRYLSLPVPLAKNKEPLSALVKRLTFLSILWQRTSISNSLATSLINSINSSFSPSLSKECLLVGWQLLTAGDGTSHRWSKSGVATEHFLVVVVTATATASCTRRRKSLEACCFSHCSTNSEFVSSHWPADTRSSSAAGGVTIVPHVLRARETTRKASRWTENCTVSCRLAVVVAHAWPGQRCVEVLIRGAQTTARTTRRMSSNRPLKGIQREMGKSRGNRETDTLMTTKNWHRYPDTPKLTD